MREVVVYLPATEGASWAVNIRRGSAMVNAAEGAPDGRIPIDYEGAVYGQTGMALFADRVDHAAGRALANYPTVARVWVHPDELFRLGTFDQRNGRVVLDDPEYAEALAAWLGRGDNTVPAEELTATGARYQMRREVDAARANGDPARMFAADQMARRYGLDR